MSRIWPNYTYQTFNRLTVLKKDYDPQKKQSFYLCQCSCGNLTKATGHDLTSGKKQSCGCLKKEMLKEGLTSMEFSCADHRSEYATWLNIRKNSVSEWKFAFQNFFEDMGKRPEKRFQIDCYDDELPYGPDNCYWWDPGTERQKQHPDDAGYRIDFYGLTKALREAGAI